MRGRDGATAAPRPDAAADGSAGSASQGPSPGAWQGAARAPASGGGPERRPATFRRPWIGPLGVTVSHNPGEEGRWDPQGPGVGRSSIRDRKDAKAARVHIIFTTQSFHVFGSRGSSNGGARPSPKASAPMGRFRAVPVTPGRPPPTLRFSYPRPLGVRPGAPDVSIGRTSRSGSVLAGHGPGPGLLVGGRAFVLGPQRGRRPSDLANGWPAPSGPGIRRDGPLRKSPSSSHAEARQVPPYAQLRNSTCIIFHIYFLPIVVRTEPCSASFLGVSAPPRPAPRGGRCPSSRPRSAG
jgi:hypothetical protein